jgi:hypothetical protein
MPIRPESSGSRVPHISLAAVSAIVAFTVESIDNQTPNNSHYVSETRHVEEFNASFEFGKYIRLVRRARHPHHSQTHPTPAQIAAGEVTPEEFAAWSKVNICEESGNWHVRGSKYSGGLGISNENWTAYHKPGYPESAADATPAEQIVVAERIQKNPPDQHGCDPGGW